MASLERDLTGLTVEELRRLVGELLGEVVRLRLAIYDMAAAMRRDFSSSGGRRDP